MQPFKAPIHIALIVMTIFLSLTALAGCIQLLEGTYAPPLEMLNGSIFKDYTVPGLALGLIVGGSAALAAVSLIRRSKFATLFAVASGVFIMIFEFVEVVASGSPAGAARTLQIFYFTLGTLIVIVSLTAWFLSLMDEK